MCFRIVAYAVSIMLLEQTSTIEEKWYYFDGNGYMVSNCYVKSLAENLYYRIGEDGVWDETGDTYTPNRAKYTVY